MRDAIALWLVHRTLGGEVWVPDLAGLLNCVLGQKKSTREGVGGLNPPHLITQPTSCPWATQHLKDVKSIKHG